MLFFVAFRSLDIQGDGIPGEVDDIRNLVRNLRRIVFVRFEFLADSERAKADGSAVKPVRHFLNGCFLRNSLQYLTFPRKAVSFLANC
jgi:hypothetical protein